MKKSENKYPRTLVISTNCFSTTTANGRVLGEFFRGWDNNAVAQFYIAAEKPSFLDFNNFFRVTDKQALKSFFMRKEYGCNIAPEKDKSAGGGNNIPASHKSVKTPLSCFVREFIWNSNAWKRKNFKRWVNEFNPEVVLLYANESVFLMKLAELICKQRNIPLVLFVTENYVLKEFNYFRNKKFGFLYNKFHKNLSRTFNRLICNSKFQIYINGQLEKDYFNKFGKHGLTLYQGTSVDEKPRYDISENPTFSYAGNLGLGRPDSLMKIGEALNAINETYHLDVYGRCTDDDTENRLKNARGINYCGFVNYEKVREVMRNSDFLFHAEAFDDFTVKDLRCAFSTKIADCLGSGRSFILYAPRGLACTEYLIENDCAVVISEKDELCDKLKTIICDKSLREKLINKAKKIAKKNHNYTDNNEKFLSIIRRACQSEDLSD